MAETWLRANMRAAIPMAIAGLIVAALAARGTYALAVSYALAHPGIWAGAAGAIVLALSASWIWPLVAPRLARRGGELLVRLRPGPPIAIPLQHVECFLLSRSTALLPGKRGARAETSTVVVRLDARQPELKMVRVDPRMGFWCNHEVTIRGVWTEPLSVERVQQLNERLAEAAATTLERSSA